MTKNKDFEVFTTEIALRLFTKHHKDFIGMMETLQSICEEDENEDESLSQLVDSFILMMDTFYDYVDFDVCEYALDCLLLGAEVEEFPDDIGDDGLYIDVTHL
jgi:hypothetical protein